MAQQGYYIYGNGSGSAPPVSDCTVQFLSSIGSNYISPGSGIVLGNSAVSPGAVYTTTQNNMITLSPGSYLFTYGVTLSGQSDFALTTNITSRTAAFSNIVPGSHFAANQNLSFQPVSVLVNVTTTTNYYLVNFYLNPILLGTAGTNTTLNYTMCYLNIIKIQ